MANTPQLRVAAQTFVDAILEKVSSALEKGDLGGLDQSVATDITDFLEKAEAPVEKAATFVLKVNDEQRMVWGWASVAVERGIPVVDTQGDVIEMDMLQKAAHDFISDYREAASMHRNREIGTVVESIVFTKELQEALGVDFDREGWFVGVHIDDEATWEKVKSGEFRAFSIGGSGVREET